MENKLYVLTYMDFSISDFKIYNSYQEALKIYLLSSIRETKKLLCDSDSENNDAIKVESDNESEEDVSCSLFVYELDGVEYKFIKDYDIDTFQDYLESIEDPSKEFLDELETKIKENNISEELKVHFSK
jgi:hypothetical protein